MDVGLGASLIQRKRLLPIHFSSVFYFNITVGLILTIITLFVAKYIAEFYQIPELENLAKTMSLSFVISSFGIVQNVKLKKQLNFKKITSLQIVGVVISGGIGIIMAKNGFGVWSLLTQILSNRFIYTLLVWITVDWTPGFNFSLKALKQLWGFGFKIFLANFLNILFNQLDVIIIGKIFPVSSLGFLQRGKSLTQMVYKLTSTSLSQVLFPVFSSIQDETARLKSILNRATHLLSLVVFVITGALYLCADEIIIILFTKKWYESIEYFKLLLLSGFVMPFNSLFINIISSRGNSTNYLKLNMIKKIPKGLVLCFGFYFGITGFLYGLILSSIINTFINILFVNRELGTNYWLLLKPITTNLATSSLLVLGITSLINRLDFENLYLLLLIKFFTFIVSYSILAILFKFDGLKTIQLTISDRKKRTPTNE